MLNFDLEFDFDEVIDAALLAKDDDEAMSILEQRIGHPGEGRDVARCYEWVLSLREHREASKAEQEAAKRCRSARRAGLKCWGAYANTGASLKELVAAEKLLLAACPWARIEPDEGLWTVGTTRLYHRDLLELCELAKHDADALNQIVEISRLGCSLQTAAEIQAMPPWKRNQALKGIRWLKAEGGNEHQDCPADVLRRFGREGDKNPDLCWVLLTAPTKLAEARKNRALRFSLLPRRVQWERLLAPLVPPEVFLRMPTEGFKVGTLKRLINEFGVNLDLSRGRSKDGVSGMTLPMLNLVRLFSDYEAIVRFVRAAGHPWSAQGVHDAGQFRLEGSGWTPARWAPFALRNPAAVKHAAEFPQLEAAGIFPRGVVELKRAVLARTYPKVSPEWQRLAELCQDYELSGSVFETYREFWKKTTVKPAEFLPAVTVLGSEVGLDDSWKFEKLAAGDYRGPMLGLMTGCCQHLTGAGSSCAEHGVKSPFSAFYVVTHNGRVVAQTWCWLRDSAVVLDSVESIVRDREQLEPVLRLFKAAIPRWLESPLGIKTVCIGTTSSGITSMVREEVKPNQGKELRWTLTPTDGCDYLDSHEQMVVAGVRAKRMPKLKLQVAGYRLAQQASWFPNVPDELLQPAIRQHIWNRLNENGYAFDFNWR